MSYQLVTIVLAAGESRRMGKPKLFLPLYGSTLLRLAVQAALDVHQHDNIIVVTGRYDEEIREHLSSFPTVLKAHHQEWQKGMASSIAFGVTIARMLHPTHLLITLADQPTVDGSALRKLLQESQAYPDQIIATAYPERLGVPAIFPVRFTEELRQQSGAFGARQLIARERDSVRAINFNNPPIDIDTPEDYALIRSSTPDDAKKEADE